MQLSEESADPFHCPQSLFAFLRERPGSQDGFFNELGAVDLVDDIGRSYCCCDRNKGTTVAVKTKVVPLLARRCASIVESNSPFDADLAFPNDSLRRNRRSGELGSSMHSCVYSAS